MGWSFQPPATSFEHPIQFHCFLLLCLHLHLHGISYRDARRLLLDPFPVFCPFSHVQIYRFDYFHWCKRLQRLRRTLAARAA